MAILAHLPFRERLIQLMYCKPVGRFAAWSSRAVGAGRISQRISPLCHYVPSVVPVNIPARHGGGTFRMRGHHARDSVARCLWWGGWESFESPLPDVFATLSRGCECVLDVGSYSGCYSMLAARCEPDARVFAFEPFPTARQMLQENLALNSLRDRITVIAEAASDRCEQRTLHVPPTTTGLLETASTLEADLYDETIERLPVQTVTLDHFAAQHQGRIGLMKVDVEAAELSVLRGASKVLTEHRPLMCVEILAAAKVQPIQALLEQHDYAIALLTRDGVMRRDRLESHADAPDQLFYPRERQEEITERLSWIRG
ncbi:MAG TPA: FkbM family methyltransferase [Phycisphaeraceae bacterium]